MKKFVYTIFAVLVAFAMFSCSDDSSTNVIDFDDNGNGNGNGDDEPGMVYSIDFEVDGGDTFTFSVDMTDAVIEGENLPDDFDGDVLEFDPEVHEVYIAGGFPGDLEWNEPGSNPDLRLSTDGRSGGTIEAGEVPYKFFLVIDGEPSWSWGEWEGDPNREIEVVSGESVLHEWADEAPDPDDDPDPEDFPESLFVPGGYQGASGYGEDWTPADAPEIGSPAAGEYSGFVYFAEGGMFKFTNADNWDEGNWGGEDGTLEAGGADLEIEDGGYYRLQADLDELTYATTHTVWYVIGDAANGWDDGDDVEMDFDAESRTWSVTLDLSDEGEFKFRANEDWDLNMGLGDEEGELFYDGDNLAVDEAGSYTVTIDLNGTTYTYDVEQN